MQYITKALCIIAKRSWMSMNYILQLYRFLLHRFLNRSHFHNHTGYVKTEITVQKNGLRNVYSYKQLYFSSARFFEYWIIRTEEQNEGWSRYKPVYFWSWSDWRKFSKMILFEEHLFKYIWGLNEKPPERGPFYPSKLNKEEGLNDTSTKIFYWLLIF